MQIPHPNQTTPREVEATLLVSGETQQVVGPKVVFQIMAQSIKGAHA